MSDTGPNEPTGLAALRARITAGPRPVGRLLAVCAPVALALPTYGFVVFAAGAGVRGPLLVAAVVVPPVATALAVLIGIALLLDPDLRAWRVTGDAAALRRSTGFALVALVPWTAIAADAIVRAAASVIAGGDHPALYADLGAMLTVGLGWWGLAAVALLPPSPHTARLAIGMSVVALLPPGVMAASLWSDHHVRWLPAYAFAAVFLAAVAYEALPNGVPMANPPVPAPNAPPTELACSFCRKSQKVVRKLVAGPDVYICDECVALSAEIIDEEARPKEPAPVPADLSVIRAAIDDACPGLAVAGPILATAIYTQRLRRHGGSAALQPARVLIVGPRGCGKSTLLAAAVRIAGLPAVHTEATRLTETGYVGENVENFLAELVDAAGSVAHAQFGVLAIDGLHHLTARGPARSGRDISGTEVQRDLLRLLDGRAAPLSWSRPRHPQSDIQRFPADRVLVIAAATVPRDVPTDDRSLRDALIADGFHDELIARFERIVALPALDPVRAMAMLRRADGPLARVRALADALGVELVVDDAGIADLAAYAAGPDGGWAVARAVAIIGEEVASGVKRVVVAGSR